MAAREERIFSCDGHRCLKSFECICTRPVNRKLKPLMLFRGTGLIQIKPEWSPVALN
jgi:hypothetical protein